MFKSLLEALGAWKGQRDMARESNAMVFGTTSDNRPTRTVSSREPEEEKIRFRAYLLAEAAGFPTGRADDFWHQAEKEIRFGKSR
jgi:Protein of unknown function (DUF2934)